MCCAKQVEESVGQAQTTLLDSLDKMIGAKMTRSLTVDAHLKPSTTSIHWSFAALHNFGEDSCSGCSDSFLKIAVMSGLTLYAKSKQRHVDNMAKSAKISLLFFGTVAPEMLNMGHFYWEPIAQYLIEHGADSNKNNRESSASIATESSDSNEISSEASTSGDTESGVWFSNPVSLASFPVSIGFESA